MNEEKFLELIDQYYEEITASKADELLEEKSGSIIFIGRETCPFSRRFIGTMTKVIKEHDLKVYFVHSMGELTDEIQAFRDKYEIKTVPGLLYSDEQTPTRVRLNSSMSEEEILEFVNA